MRNIFKKALIAEFFLLLSFGIAFADDSLFQACMDYAKPSCQIWAKHGGGGEMPHGLSSDTKAELAVGETYLISGTVVITGDSPYLQIDFGAYPWLASEMRVKRPFYRINAAASHWEIYEGQEVTLVAQARYSAWQDRKGRSYFEIYLQPSSDSIIEGLQRSRRRR